MRWAADQFGTGADNLPQFRVRGTTFTQALVQTSQLGAANVQSVTGESFSQLVPQWQIDGTPTVVVAGKYRVTGASAGGYDKVFDVVDFLVAKESVR